MTDDYTNKTYQEMLENRKKYLFDDIIKDDDIFAVDKNTDQRVYL